MLKTWIIQSQIVVGRESGKPIEVKLAENAHKANKIIGSLLDGTPVVVSIRQGRGGVPVNKLTTGKIYAVAADSFTPIYEKENGKNTTTQKTDRDGALCFSSGAVYLLSTHDYKSLILGRYFTYISNNGDDVFMLDEQAIATRQQIVLKTRGDISMLLKTMAEWLDPQFHWMKPHLDAINKLKSRKIRHAKEQAEDDGEAYSGVEPTTLDADPRDGGPVFFMDVRSESDPTRGAFSIIQSSTEEINQMTGQITYKSVNPVDRVKAFKQTDLFRRIVQAIDANKSMIVSYTNGSFFRTSISTKKKFSNATESGASNGDAFFCKNAQGKWVNSIVGILHSMHPHFPKADYEVNHFVAAIRQAELAMAKQTESWFPYDIPSYDIQASIYSGDIIPVPLGTAKKITAEHNA